MDVRVQGTVAPDPFLSAAALLETEYNLTRPVEVHIREDPDERTWAAHYDDHHVLNMSRQAATSVLARELALHEFAHMARYEQRHASHTQSTDEALFLALAGESVERRKLAHCYQIANHMKDIYADDIWLSVAPADKLVDFLESSLASALADHPPEQFAWGRMEPTPADGTDAVDTPAADRPPRHTSVADPEITAVNAAFALGLVERHNLVDERHRLYDLAHAAAADAPEIDLQRFKQRFRSLAADPDESEYRKTLVDATRAYAGGQGPAAD